VDQGGSGLHRFQRVEDGRKRLVFHVDAREGFFGRVGIDGGDGGHLFPHETHGVFSQQRHIPDHAAHPHAGRVFAGDHGPDSRQTEGSGGVDIDDAGMGKGASQHLAPDHAGQSDVGGVQERSRHLVRTFLPGDRSSHHCVSRHGSIPSFITWWLFLDARVVDVRRSYHPIVVTISSLKP